MILEIDLWKTWGKLWKNTLTLWKIWGIFWGKLDEKIRITKLGCWGKIRFCLRHSSSGLNSRLTLMQALGIDPVFVRVEWEAWEILRFGGKRENPMRQWKHRLVFII